MRRGHGKGQPLEQLLRAHGVMVRQARVVIMTVQSVSCQLGTVTGRHATVRLPYLQEGPQADQQAQREAHHRRPLKNAAEVFPPCVHLHTCQAPAGVT